MFEFISVTLPETSIYLLNSLFYREILREHRRLPPSMRHLGDSYVRNEFNLHKKAKPEHLEKFYNAWESYLENIKQKSNSFGSNMSPSLKKKMTDEQKLKMNDLKIETAKIRFPENHQGE